MSANATTALTPTPARLLGCAALAGLRRRRWRALELKLAGFSYREIMELLGVTYTNVNRHLTEARAELRRAA